MPSKKRATPVSLQPLDALFGTNEETTNGISEIAIGSLHPFTNHPFQVRDTDDGGAGPFNYAKAPLAHDDFTFDETRYDDYELLLDEDIIGELF